MAHSRLDLHIAWSGPLQIILAFISLYRLIGWQSFVGVAIMVISVSVPLYRMREAEVDVSGSAASHQHCHLEVPEGSTKRANGKQGRSNAIDERDSDKH